ncbi:MAG: putative metal-dependent HD superfamily phosphohydrolase [Flavobacteriales bacterium]|jgi:predicted metal-dependent HD superfamily phosphohydrolase
MNSFRTFVSQNELISQAEDVAHRLITKKHSSEYTYHNLDHTLRVSKKAFELGARQNLSVPELHDLIIAALFHDTGYYDSVNDHERIGAAYATDFLQTNTASTACIERVNDLILSTKITTPPETLLQETLCDADLNYLGATEFFSLVERLRSEWLLTGRKNFTEKAWIQQNIDFFELHTFYTSAAQQLFGHVKEENLNQMRKDLRALSISSRL